MLKLFLRDLVFYKKIAILFILTATICAAVISSALFVGDSIHKTLENQVEKRLMGVESVYNDRYILPTEGYLKIDAYLQHNQLATSVVIYGVEDSILKGRKMLANQAFISYFKPKNGEFYSFYFKSPQLRDPTTFAGISEESLQSVRFELEGLFNGEFANFNLVNTPTPALNVFVNRDELSKICELEAGTNCIISKENADLLNEKVIKNLKLHTLGLYFETDSQENIYLKSKEYFLPDWIEDEVNGIASLTLFAKSLGKNQYFFITGISTQEKSINTLTITPYSNLLEIDNIHKLELLGVDTQGQIQTISCDISDYKKIWKKAPLLDSFITHYLTPRIHGLTDANDCKSWNNDYVSIDSITQADEIYWKRFGVRPKVILNIDQLRAFAPQFHKKTTAIILENNADTQKIEQKIIARFLKERSQPFTISPRENAFIQVYNGVNYTGLFIGLSLFLVGGALIVQHVILRLMIALRQGDFEHLRLIGVEEKLIKKVFFIENVFCTLLGSILGVIIGYFLCTIYLTALQSIWNDALGFEFIEFHAGITWIFLSILLTTVSGLLYSLSPQKLKLPKKRRSNTIHYLYAFKMSLRNVIRFKRENRWVIILLILSTMILGIMTFYKNITLYQLGDYTYIYQTILPYQKPIKTETPIKIIHVFGEDEASCKNPHQVLQPQLFITDTSDLPIHLEIAPDAHCVGGFVEKSVMNWVMKKEIGDIIEYQIKGKNIKVQLIGYINNSLFQGGILIDKNQLSDYRNAHYFMSQESEAPYLMQLLSPYGLKVQTLNHRIATFDAVQNRYIEIFSLLGWIGLGLGIMGSIILLMRQFHARKDEFLVLEEIGYSTSTTHKIRLYEILLVCCSGLLGGFIMVGIVLLMVYFTQ